MSATAYARANRLAKILSKALRLPRQHPSIMAAWERVWCRTAGLVCEKPDAEGLYPYRYRKLPAKRVAA